jgi:hypothetical protein
VYARAGNRPGRRRVRAVRRRGYGQPAMGWTKRIRLRWVVAAYFSVGQLYVWWQYLTITPGHTRTPAEVIVPTVLEIITALVIAGYVILAYRSLIWVILATLNAIVLLIIDFATWYVSIGTTSNWEPRLTRFDGLAVALGTLTTAGAPGIVPRSELARHIVTTQLVVDIVAAIVLFGLFVGRISGRTPAPVEEVGALRPPGKSVPSTPD